MLSGIWNRKRNGNPSVVFRLNDIQVHPHGPILLIGVPYGSIEFKASISNNIVIKL